MRGDAQRGGTGRCRARALVALVALVVGLPLAAARPAAATQGDTAAVSVNTRDGSSVFRLAFQIRRVTQEVVDQTNAAVAYASCSDCQTVAVSLQVVLVFSDPAVVSPENYAIAVNELCSSCVTVASATQIVVGGDGVVRFTDDGNRRLAELHQRLARLRTEGLPPDQLAAELEAISQELHAIVASELVPAGAEGAPGATTTTTTTTTSPTTSTTGAPTTASTTTTSTTAPTTTAPEQTTTTQASTTTAP